MPEHAPGSAPPDAEAPDSEALETPSPRTSASEEGPRADPLTAMTPRFNLFFRFFAKRFFERFDLDEGTVATLRDLESRGAVVYVMRYASRLDYFLFNTLFRHEGLRLSSFANGIRFWYYRPLRDAWRTLRGRPRGVPQDVELVRAREYCRELTREGGSFFLFLRTARLQPRLRGRQGAIEQSRQERDLLTEVVAAAQSSGRPVHVVPLALFWRKGPRARRRFLNLSYGALTRPNDVAKVLSFLTTYRGIHVKVGEAIDVPAFLATRSEPTPQALARVIRRTLLSYLYREERVVEGPVLQPLYRVQDTVVRSPAVRAAAAEYAAENKVSEERAQVQAEKLFREVAANMSSTFLAILDILVGAVIKRLFVQVEDSGMEKVREASRRDPIVLVPTHRSYFDFLIISVLFYRRHMVPPHIAARDNMAFGPFGFLWRRAGAFFLRKSFDDPLYKAVFRTYVSYLIKEGFTQEFFIEGGRSRTGKTLPPRLGMLAWDVEAFLASGRRDLLFVPLALTYERLVEEGAMVGELEGAEKSEESMLGLVRAWRFLQRRFGSVFVNVGEPISLADAMGDRRALIAREDDAGVQARRDFVVTLGNEIVEGINRSVVPHATSVAACALLGDERRGLFREDLALRMQQLVDVLRIMDVKLTPSLLRDEGDFSVSIASLLRMDLIRKAEDARGEILFFEPGRRRALDIYRNTIQHFLAVPSFLARELGVGGSRAEIDARLDAWLDLFYGEFFARRDPRTCEHIDLLLRQFADRGWIQDDGGAWRATEAGASHLAFLAEQTRSVVEGYQVAFAAIARLDEPIGRKALRKRISEQFERSELLGEAGMPEASNPVTFGNAVDLLLRRGILAAAEGAPTARDPLYERGPQWDQLAALREQLATALPSR
ncbi:MAG: 1-acyl-sn-glycerol-3-phosphate acyltransferase [Myxococcota bacterium]